MQSVLPHTTQQSSSAIPDTGKPPVWIPGHPGHDRVVLWVLFCAVFVVNLFFPRDLWVQDEARYGEVLREMLATGTWEGWLVPHLNGYTYPDKPPFYFWLVAAFSFLFGQGEFAFRLVSILSTALAAWGVYLTGRVFGGAVCGFWSAAVFTTVLLTVIVGQIVRMDMLLCVSAVFAWYSLLRFHRGEKSRLALFWAMAALGLAVKGPIALLFTVAPGAVWLGMEAGWRGVIGMRLLSGMTALTALVGMWITFIMLTGNQDYLDNIWHKQLVGRAVSSWSHKEPFYFYAMLLPLVLMPWTAAVIAGGRWLMRLRPPDWRSIILFSLVPLFGISLVSGKLFIYMQPMFPALCVAAALGIMQWQPRKRLPLWVTLPPVVFILAFSIGIFWTAPTFLATRSTEITFIVTAGLLLATAMSAAAFLQKQAWLYSTLAAFAVFSWLLGAVVYYVNPINSARALGTAVARHAGDNKIGLVHATRGILNYYSGRIMEELDRTHAKAWLQSNSEAVLIVKTADLHSVFGSHGVPPQCGIHETYRVELKGSGLVEYHVFQHCRFE